MLLEIKDPKIAKAWVKDGLEKKKKIMGFGHRMYKTEDPRATHLRKMSEELCKKTGHEYLYLLSREVEAAMLELKNIYPNVDFYSASVYYCMGIDLELYTPIFALSRVSGWLAHILEQLANNRLIRPEGEYVGPQNVEYVPIEKQSLGLCGLIFKALNARRRPIPTSRSGVLSANPRSIPSQPTPIDSRALRRLKTALP